MIETIIILVVFGVVTALVWCVYNKGRLDENRDVMLASTELLAKSAVAQEKREANHVLQIESVLADPSVDDIKRMLSETPVENTATRSAAETARGRTKLQNNKKNKVLSDRS